MCQWQMTTRTCHAACKPSRFTTIKEVGFYFQLIFLNHICAPVRMYWLTSAEDEDEISFNPVDIITDIEMIDEGWWKGRCHGRTGLFPAAYVQLTQ